MLLRCNGYISVKIAISIYICLWGTIAYAEMRDPTKPPMVASVVARNGFTLTAIMISSDKKVAVINNKVVHVGDDIDNATVKAIYDNTVELESPSGSFNLTLMNTSILSEEK